MVAAVVVVGVVAGVASLTIVGRQWEACDFVWMLVVESRAVRRRQWICF